MIRRTISIDDFINQKVNEYRGQLLANFGAELDYTTALNMFAEIGIRKTIAIDNAKDLAQLVSDPVIKQAIAKYSSYVGLETEAAIDKLQDQIIKNLPNIVRQLQHKQ